MKNAITFIECLGEGDGRSLNPVKRSRDKVLHAIRSMDIDDDADWPPERTKDEEAAWASYRGEDNDE